MKKALDVKEQSVINLPPRLRMSAIYAVSQSCNGRVVNTCNLSEDWVGYSTRYGDSVGDFSPLSHFTVTEVKQIGKYLGLPINLVDKVPSDGLSGKTDEDNLGFTYEEVNRVIRLGDETVPHFEEIVKKYKSSNFKLKLIQMEYYDPGLPDYFLEKYGI